VYSAEMVVSCARMNESCARAAKGRQGKTREDHGVQSVCVCISVAVDYLREAEWKACYLGFELFVGFGLGHGRGAGRWTQFDHDPVVIKSGQFLALRINRLPLRRPPIRQDLAEAPSLAWVSVFSDPTVTSLGRDNTHSNWLRACFDLASISSMLDRRHAASHWPSLCTT
jgi:hypothetical protein